jgi:hypothetical protein
LHLFFDARTPAAGKSHAIGRPADEIPLEFIAADANGFGMQSRDFGHLLNAAMPPPPGFASGHPTSLLFIQTAENQIEETMVFPCRMFASLTCRTPTFVNRTFHCHHRPPSLVRPENYQIQSNRGIDVGRVLENCGGQLYKRYHGSATAVVLDLIPRQNWCEWMFTRVPPRFWDRLENHRRYVKWLGKRLGFRRVEDWRQVRRKDFYENYGGSLLGMYHSQWDLLKECFPERDRQSLATDGKASWLRR